MKCGQAGADAAPTALVVGGTGMLAGVVRGLVRAGHRTAVVAREAERVRFVAATTPDPGRVVAVPADYTVPGALARALDAALGAGPGPGARIGTAVVWVHSPHRSAVHEALEDRLAQDALVVDVLGHALGSAALDPSPAGTTGSRSLPVRIRRTYRRVILGFADGPEGTRWLTHQEISDGVLAAVEPERQDAVTVVGRVAPWSQRPS